MIERYTDVREREKNVLLNIYSQYGIGIFRDVADRELQDYEFNRNSTVELFDGYFQAPKRLGAIDEESLSFVTLEAITFADYQSTPNEIKSELFELAGTTAWETAFVMARSSHNSIHTVSERLNLIETSDRLNSLAKQIHPTNTVEYHRIGLREVFSQVMKDIVCGEITTDTVEETRILLSEKLAEVSHITDKADALGLVGEIKVLQHFWENYRKDRDMVAVPSTLRGGSGHYRPEETHDIDVLRQRKDRTWVTVSPVEVKKRKLRDDEYRRYGKSLLAYVAPDGQISFTSWHRSRPQPDEGVA